MLHKYKNQEKDTRYKHELFFNIGKFTPESESLYLELSKKYAVLKNKVKNPNTKLSYENMLNSLNVQYLMYQGKYEDALQEMKHLSGLSTQAEKLSQEYKEAVCLYQLNSKEASEKFFRHIVQDGNTLNIVKLSQEFIENMNNN